MAPNPRDIDYNELDLMPPPQRDNFKSRREWKDAHTRWQEQAIVLIAHRQQNGLSEEDTLEDRVSDIEATHEKKCPIAKSTSWGIIGKILGRGAAMGTIIFVVLQLIKYAAYSWKGG